MTYFIRIRGKAFGPFDEEQLLNMKSQGKLGKTTEVSENKTDWQPAETLDFLYPQVSSGSSLTNQAYSTGGQVYSTQAEPADWNYSVNGTEGFGPVTVAAIEQMLRSGHLNGNSYVWQQGQNARFIKHEPRFSTSVGGSVKLSMAESGNMADVGGEITGTSEKVDTGKMLRPIAASLGWLMFLKIAFLLSLIVEGLYLLWAGAFWIPYAVKSDNATVLLVVLIVLVICTGLYALQFKTFLCFWKFHTVLNQTVATGRASDLIAANQRQFLFWKWLGITVIACLSVVLVVVTVVMALSGSETGNIIRSFRTFPGT